MSNKEQPKERPDSRDIYWNMLDGKEKKIKELEEELEHLKSSMRKVKEERERIDEMDVISDEEIKKMAEDVYPLAEPPENEDIIPSDKIPFVVNFNINRKKLRINWVAGFKAALRYKEIVTDKPTE